MSTVQRTRDALDEQRVEREGKVRALEVERAGLVLDASMGDLKARKRLKAVRTEIAEHGLAIADLDEAFDDLEDAVRREQSAAVREARVAGAAAFARLSEHAAGVLGEVDAAIEVLRAAAAKAVPVLEQVRDLGTRLTLQNTPGDPGLVAMNMMLGVHFSSLRDLPDVLGERLSDLGVLPEGFGGHYRPKGGPLRETYSHGFEVLRDRLQLRIDDDDAAAIAAEVA